jgi:hypothetical protein
VLAAYSIFVNIFSPAAPFRTYYVVVEDKILPELRVGLEVKGVGGVPGVL